jgi:hypothetical protein
MSKPKIQVDVKIDKAQNAIVFEVEGQEEQTLVLLSHPKYIENFFQELNKYINEQHKVNFY